MSDDFGTVNMSRADVARENDALREEYRRHRAAIESLIDDAPDALAQQYVRILDDIDNMLAKLDPEATAPVAPVTPRASTPPPPPPPPAPPTEPGMRPLVTTPNEDYVPAPDRKPGASMKHVFGIIAIAAVAFAVLGYLMWRASDRKEAGSGTVIEDSTSPVTTQTQDETSETSEPSDTATSAPPTSTTAATPPVAGNALTATPPAQDYGTVGKGTRAVRRFTLTNTSGQAIKLKVSRSACHCLYYTHKPSIAANGRETLTITVDGAKARVGALHETVEITSADGSVRTSVDVNATIR